MSGLAKGGRGKKAPYESSHYRIPTPLKPLVEELAANYRELVQKYQDPEDPNLINGTLMACAGNQVEKNESQSQHEAALTQDVVLNAVNNFIEAQKNSFGSNPAQRGKEFSTDSRSWDNFKKFVDWVKANPQELE